MMYLVRLTEPLEREENPFQCKVHMISLQRFHRLTDTSNCIQLKAMYFHYFNLFFNYSTFSTDFYKQMHEPGSVSTIFPPRVRRREQWHFSPGKKKNNETPVAISPVQYVGHRKCMVCNLCPLCILHTPCM